MRNQLSLIAAGLLLVACTEVSTKYRVDEHGHLQKLGVVARHGTRASYRINNSIFDYDLRSIGGALLPVTDLVIALRPGQSKIPFSAQPDATLFGGVRETFSGNIRRPNKTALAVDDLRSEARPGGETEHMFFPEAKPSAVDYQTINGRRWLVTTKFEDDAKQIVRGQVWWTVIDGFLVTFNVQIYEDAPRDAKWRNERVGKLQKLVSAFRYSRTS
jgi:hypothetical protein